MRSVALVLTLTGCQQIFGLDQPRSLDAAIDTPDDAASVNCIDRWQQGPQLTSPVPLASVNTTASEGSPFVTPNGLVLYFERDGDFYRAERATTNDAFGPAAVVSSLATGATEERIYVIADETEAFFSSNRAGGSGGGYDIWHATSAGPSTPFTVDQMYLTSVDDGGAQRGPQLSSDLRDLYFGDAGRISVAQRAQTTDAFGAAAPLTGLGPNAFGDPSVDKDELVLVLATIGGAPDLYYATRTSTGASFSLPKPVPDTGSVGSTVETSPFISEDGCTLYFSSDRDGSYDLFVMTVR